MEEEELGLDMMEPTVAVTKRKRSGVWYDDTNCNGAKKGGDVGSGLGMMKPTIAVTKERRGGT